MSSIAKAFAPSSAKPALVLIHGLGSAGTIWKSLLPELTKYFSVFAIDLPGHGEAPLTQRNNLDPRSLAQSIVKLMEEKHGLKSMHVAGNSLGGWIALEMAAIAPHRISSVTALAPAGLWHQGPSQPLPPTFDSRILAKITQYIMPLAYHLAPLKAYGYRKITHLWRELDYEACKDSVIAMAKSKGYLPLWKSLRGKKFESQIPESVKVSIIFGDNDLTLPEEIAQEKSLVPPHSEWIVVKNCAHVIMWNFPEKSVDFIRRTAGLL